MANSDDLPLPFAPIRPMRCPACTWKLAFSMRILRPRRRLMLLRLNTAESLTALLMLLFTPQQGEQQQ